MSTHSYTNTQYNELKSSSISVIRTTVGNGAGIIQNINGYTVAASKTGFSDRYLIWSGTYTAEQLASRTWSPTVTTNTKWTSKNQQTGFMGIFYYAYTHNLYVNNSPHLKVDEIYFRTSKDDTGSYRIFTDNDSYLTESDFTLIPLIG